MIDELRTMVPRAPAPLEDCLSVRGDARAEIGAGDRQRHGAQERRRVRYVRVDISVRPGRRALRRLSGRREDAGGCEPRLRVRVEGRAR